MSARKYYREMVRSQAAAHGVKASRAVHNWRRILGLYPDFVGKKNQKPGSKQRVLVYPMPRGGIRHEKG